MLQGQVRHLEEVLSNVRFQIPLLEKRALGLMEGVVAAELAERATLVQELTVQQKADLEKADQLQAEIEALRNERKATESASDALAQRMEQASNELEAKDARITELEQQLAAEREALVPDKLS